MLKEGQIFGALLQLKDVFEVLIKFPILIVASNIYHKSKRTKVENEILEMLLGRPLFLRDWQDTGSHILEINIINKDISELIKDMVAMYKREDIPGWRNDNIGHGALVLSTDKSLQEDIKKKILLIKEHLIKFEAIYSKMNFYILKNVEKIFLTGKDKARNLNLTGELFVEIDKLKQNLYPYILLKSKGIYFFDTYDSRKQKTSILNYPEGDRENLKKDEFINLYNLLLKDCEEINLLSTLEDETYSALEDEIINKRSDIDDFQKPEYLDKWIKENINNYSKGIFLLQMEKEMGKTIFSKALDEQSLNRLSLNDFSVRAYYINDTYSYKTKNFETHINDILRENKNGDTVITGNLPVFSTCAESKKKDLARLVNFYKKEHYRFFGKEKLLLIIDGLDEIPQKEANTIFDFIPEENMIDDGIYILLTSRLDRELTNFNLKKLNSINPTVRGKYSKNDQEYFKLLTDYIKKYIKFFEIGKGNLNRLKGSTIPGHKLDILKSLINIKFSEEKLRDNLIELNFNREEISVILNQCSFNFQDKDMNLFLNKERSFNYLKIFKDVLPLIGIIDFNHFPEKKNLFKYYLSTIEKIYGKKYFYSFLKILSIISEASKPLTVEEISYYSGEGRPTFKLLGNLSDMKKILNIDRSIRGNLIVIAYEEFKKVIMEIFEN